MLEWFVKGKKNQHHSQNCEMWHTVIFTADICYYIATEFDYRKRDSQLAAYGGVVLQWFVWGKNSNRHHSQNCDMFAIKMTYMYFNAVKFQAKSHLHRARYKLNWIEESYMWPSRPSQVIMLSGPPMDTFEAWTKISLRDHRAKYMACFELCISSPWSGSIF